MLKKVLWELLATSARRFMRKTGVNESRNYEDAINSKPEILLKDLLSHAHNNVPYYHKILPEFDVVKNGKVYLANFRQLPVLNKKTIRHRFSELISKDYEKRQWHYNTSSGSTGEPLEFIQDRLSSTWSRYTHKWYYENMLGVNETFAKKILLWAAADVFKKSFGLRDRMAKTINDTLTNTVVLDVTRMTRTDMERYVRTINSYKPQVIRGYANALYEICKFARKGKPIVHTPEVVISSAEMLRDDLRKEIEDAFGTKVYDYYGSREVDGIAGECRRGLLHIFMFNNYVEVTDHNFNTVQEGENGKVIVTTLHNYSMPFIRYEIGDMALLGPEKCKCGNPLPTLRKITGRVCCFFRKADGTLIDDGYFMGLFAQNEGIQKFRIIQEDYRKIRILAVLRDETIEARNKREIEEKIKMVMGSDCIIKWQIVDEIPKTKMGKYLYTQSLVDA